MFNPIKSSDLRFFILRSELNFVHVTQQQHRILSSDKLLGTDRVMQSVVTFSITFPMSSLLFRGVDV